MKHFTSKMILKEGAFSKQKGESLQVSAPEKASKGLKMVWKSN